MLRRAGRAVTLGPPGLRCCGRPLISNGLLDKAVANARHNVELLYEWSRQGRPIVACEPSCILTIRDDYPALLRGEPRSKAESVAAACLTLEELLAPIVAGEACRVLSEHWIGEGERPGAHGAPYEEISQHPRGMSSGVRRILCRRTATNGR